MTIDTIAFRLVTGSQEFGSSIEFSVNGQDFIEMVRRVELPFAEAEGHPEIAGAYIGPPACIHSPPSRHFWGESKYGRQDGKVELLICRDCGEIGCWPLLARIIVQPSRIVWCRFEQPHRKGRGQLPAWCYDDFGPFVFDRGQYEAALQILCHELGSRSTP